MGHLVRIANSVARSGDSDEQVGWCSGELRNNFKNVTFSLNWRIVE